MRVLGGGSFQPRGRGIYKGLAIGWLSGLDTFLYATNVNSGDVDVFDGNFAPTALTGSFTDPNADVAADGYALRSTSPTSTDNLYVTYAKQNDAKAY